MEKKDFDEFENNYDNIDKASSASVGKDSLSKETGGKHRKKKAKRTRKKMSKGKKALVITLSIIGSLLLLLIIAAICVVFYINSKLDLMPRTYDSDITVVDPENESFEQDDEDLSDSHAMLPVVDPEDIEWDNIRSFDDDDHINILLVGQDRYKDTGVRQRSDTMILCSINTETNKISLISFLRDLYVQIPGGYSDNRLNATYVFGGFPLLNETLEKNFGIHVDYNFEVDFTGFENIINYFGGIDVDLTEAEADWLNNTISWVFKHDPVEPGVNRLNGAQALHYARIRKLDSDFGRTSRQRNVINIVFNKLKNLSVTELLEVAEDILPYMTTDMTNSDIWGLLFEIAPEISDIKIESYSVPASDDFYYARIRGMSVIVPDLPTIREKLENEYLPY